MVQRSEPDRGFRSGTAFRRWRVDPRGGWFVRRCWRFVDEPLTIFGERAAQGPLPRGMDGVDLAVMHPIRGHRSDPGVVAVLVVPGEELTAEAPGILDAAEALWEARLIFQSFDLAFRERVVVGRMRAVVRSGDARIGRQQRDVPGPYLGVSDLRVPADWL